MKTVSASNSNIRWLPLPETYYDATATLPFCVLHGQEWLHRPGCHRVYIVENNADLPQSVKLHFKCHQTIEFHTNIMVLILGIKKITSQMFSSRQENWQFGTIK